MKKSFEKLSKERKCALGITFHRLFKLYLELFASLILTVFAAAPFKSNMSWLT